MFENDEQKQIDRAALLHDTPPAEKLDTDRARSFVSSAMGKPASGGFVSRHRTVAYGAAVLFAAAAAVAAVIMVNPGAADTGPSAVLPEQTYVHASKATVDSVAPAVQDSLVVEIHESE